MSSYAFHTLDQAPLEVTRTTGFYCRVNESFSPCHCMEIVFLRANAGQEATSHISACTKTRVEWSKTRQCFPTNHDGNSSTLENLLTKKTRYLGRIDIRTFGS